MLAPYYEINYDFFFFFGKKNILYRAVQNHMVSWIRVTGFQTTPGLEHIGI